MSTNNLKTSSPNYPLLGQTLVKTSGNDASCKPSPGLYLVATPIGNLGDITLRALMVMSHADIIACEDTRSSGFLLKSFGITRPTLSYHDHNADARRPDILERLKRGDVVVLISDAGMPTIADPGFKLVRECRDQNIAVTVIPGANAAITAIAGCGLPTDQFYFAGFLSPKTVARKKEILALKSMRATLIFYETPQRLHSFLNDMVEILGPERHAAVARELTKYFEETRRGTLGALADYYAAHDVKGEIVVVVGGHDGQEQSYNIDDLLSQRLSHLSVRDAVAEVAEMTGGKKKDIYVRALHLAHLQK